MIGEEAKEGDRCYVAGDLLIIHCQDTDYGDGEE